MAPPETWQQAQWAIRRALLLGPAPAPPPRQEPDQGLLPALDLRAEPIGATSGALGALASPLKHQLRRLLRPWLIDRQSDYNTAVAAQLHSLTRRLEALEEAVRVTAPAEGAREVMEHIHYLDFEGEFRGSEDSIAERQSSYADHFDPEHRVLDIGCGRGDFVEILLRREVEVEGVDLDADAVRRAQERGLPVHFGDAEAFLATRPPEHYGGIFAGQVVEHLQPAQLATLLEAAYRSLRPGGVIVLETLNPESWPVVSRWFPLDLSHVALIHPETLSFLLRQAGFTVRAVQFRQEIPAEERLPTLTGVEGADEFNAAIERVNDRLFGPLDYFVVAEK